MYTRVHLFNQLPVIQGNDTGIQYSLWPLEWTKHSCKFFWNLLVTEYFESLIQSEEDPNIKASLKLDQVVLPRFNYSGNILHVYKIYRSFSNKPRIPKQFEDLGISFCTQVPLFNILIIYFPFLTEVFSVWDFSHKPSLTVFLN